MGQNHLSHHGIKGQRWGIRRFQFKDGKLTIAGRKRYSENGTETKGNSANKKSGKSKKKGSASNEPTQKKDVKKMNFLDKLLRVYKSLI